MKATEAPPTAEVLATPVGKRPKLDERNGRNPMG
jgi:hypothetical protein